MADNAEKQLGWWDKLFPTRRVLGEAAGHVAGAPAASAQKATDNTGYDTSYIKGQIKQHMGVVEPAKKKPIPQQRGLRKALPK